MKPMRHSKSPRPRDRGVALVMVLIFLSLMMLLGMAITMTGITEVSISGSAKLAMEAFDTADAGTSYAYELVRNMRGDFTCLLRGPDGQLKSGDEFTQRPSQVFNTSGVEITPTSPPLMFDSAKVAPIPNERGRALVRIDGRHFFELVVYDNANDPYSYLGDAALELSQDPYTGPAVLTNGAVSGGTDGDPRVDCDQRVLIRSIGYVMRADASLGDFEPGNAIATATADIVVGLNPYPAIVSNSDLAIRNNVQITGALGGVHANDDLALGTGNWTVAQGATFTNSDTANGFSGGGYDVNVTTDSSHVAGYNGPADEIYLPDLNPYAYANKADTVFIHGATTSDQRKVLLKNLYGSWADGVAALEAMGVASPLTTTTNVALQKNPGGGYTLGTVAGNGSYSSGGVSVDFSGSGDMSVSAVPAFPNGTTLFFLIPVGDEEVQINSNTTGQVSVLTNGNAKLNGNTNLRPKLVLTPPEAPPWDRVDVLILAGEDCDINGSAGAIQEEGIIYAHEQFRLSGSGTFKGQIIGYERALVYDAASEQYVSNPNYRDTTLSPVAAGASSVEGSFDLQHDISRGYLGSFSQAAWRQLRDFPPASARP